VSFAGEYRERVFAHFLAEYRAGRTPNPDVLCNREIKFGVCLDYARRLGASRLATGHYARLDASSSPARLLRAFDGSKDQSYFLHGVGAPELAQALFPVGDLQKSDVRALARERGLPVFDKPDSTGICFIGERPFREFLARYLPAQPGAIETPEGHVLGSHGGLMYYTLGQRQGLGIGGQAGAPEAAWYVAGKDLARNVLVVVQGQDHPLLASDEITTDPVHWIAARPPATAFDCTVKVRYRQADQPCSVVLSSQGDARVHLHVSQRAVTPGQYAVFYRGEECLGGAVIASIGPSEAAAAA
jgi:tRNA-specific 2-thiouridylase